MRQGRHEAIALAVAGVAAVAVVAAMWPRRRPARQLFDYSDRSGFPKPPEEMRGIARNRGQSPVSAAMSP